MVHILGSNIKETGNICESLSKQKLSITLRFNVEIQCHILISDFCYLPLSYSPSCMQSHLFCSSLHLFIVIRLIEAMSPASRSTEESLRKREIQECLVLVQALLMKYAITEDGESFRGQHQTSPVLPPPQIHALSQLRDQLIRELLTSQRYIYGTELLQKASRPLSSSAVFSPSLPAAEVGSAGERKEAEAST